MMRFGRIALGVALAVPAIVIGGGNGPAGAGYAACATNVVTITDGGAGTMVGLNGTSLVSSGPITVTGGGCIDGVGFPYGPGCVPAGTYRWTCTPWLINGWRFNMNGGNDAVAVRNASGYEGIELHGGDGDDFLDGTGVKDKLFGERGRDTLTDIDTYADIVDCGYHDYQSVSWDRHDTKRNC